MSDLTENFRDLSYFIFNAVRMPLDFLQESWPTLYRVNFKIPEGLGKYLRQHWIKPQLFKDNFELKL